MLIGQNYVGREDRTECWEKERWSQRDKHAESLLVSHCHMAIYRLIEMG